MSLFSVEALSAVPLADLPYALPADAQSPIVQLFGGIELGFGAVNDEVVADAAVPDPASAFVDAGQLVTGLTPSNQADVLNSLLFAQLEASAKTDRQNYADWYAAYSDVLKNVGWVFNGGEVTKFDASGSDFSIDKVALDIISAALTGPEIVVITAAITSLRTLAAANDHRITLFDRSSHTATSANFQIGSSSDVGGVVTLKSASFSLTTTEVFTNVMFFHFHHGSTTLSHSLDTLTLDTEVYANVRTSIAEKLGERAKNYIADIPLAP